MHLSYDPQYNIAYIRFRSKRAKVTTVAVSDELNVDIGPDGRLYGIELLNANQQLGSARIKTLARIFHQQRIWVGGGSSAVRDDRQG